MKTAALCVWLWLLPTFGLAQGTFEYDQQSASETTGGGGVYSIAASQPLGQSFTPALSSIGFVRLFITGFSGASMAVNLRTNSITGPVLGTSENIFFATSATGYSNFFFATPVTLTPGVTYFFQPVLKSGAGNIIAYNYDYPGGTAYFNGVPDPFLSDLWFREGIIVPEPSCASLCLLGAAVLVWRAGGRPRNGRSVA